MVPSTTEIIFVVRWFGAPRETPLVYGMVRSSLAYATRHPAFEGNNCYGKLQEWISTVILPFSTSRCPLQVTTFLNNLPISTLLYKKCFFIIYNENEVSAVCSAGIGRTCTFIAIALGVDQLCKTPESIDVFSTVSRLRRQRFVETN